MHDDYKARSGLALMREQARVIDALIIREIYTRFGRENIGFLWIFAEPALFCLGVVALWSITQHSNHKEISLVAFVVTGYMPLIVFRHIITRLLRCMQSNAPLLYYRQVTVMALYLARIWLEIISASATFAVLMVLFYLLDIIDPPADYPKMFFAWLLYCWFSAALGMTIGAIAERSEIVEKLWTPVSYIMIPFSGTFYMLYWLPQGFREALLWSPQVSGVEMLRSGYFGEGIQSYYSVPYLVGMTLVLTCVGLYLVSRAREHIEVD
ncbi:ABC transporter permease [Micromonospora sp. STR1s_5]|nr:ABC transporter permease [Micromonospora sp. STR1s_5]